jgi:hypothetical protein
MGFSFFDQPTLRHKGFSPNRPPGKIIFQILDFEPPVQSVDSRVSDRSSVTKVAQRTIGYFQIFRRFGKVKQPA